MSLVEVSLSTVMALNEAFTPDAEQFLQDGRRQLRVGEHERQHRRHVGRDHARAFGDAVDRDPMAVDLGGAVASFGNVSVVMIASAASRQPSAAPASAS